MNEVEGAIHDEEPMRWTPILHGADERRARNAIVKMAERIDGLPVPDGSLAAGAAGIGLCFTYLFREHASDRLRKRAASLLSRTIGDWAWSSQLPLSFMAGATGAAWVKQHVSRSEPAILEDWPERMWFDETLLSHLQDEPWRGTYDLSDGLVGFGVYGLERMPDPLAATLVRLVVDRLADIALPQKHGIAWWTAPQNLEGVVRDRFPHGCFNLGVPHGVPGAISFLAQAFEAGVADERARVLVEQAVAWLLNQRTPPDAGSSFSSVIPFGGGEHRIHQSRVAWCYGDLGVAAVLYSVAVKVKERRWAEIAIEIANAVARRSLDRSRATTPGLCHGAAGNSHLFNRFFQATRASIFLDAAHYWLQQTLEYCEATNVEVGCGVTEQPTSIGSEASWLDMPGLFNGLAGIVLVLTAAVSENKPEWDKVLCASMPCIAAR